MTTKTAASLRCRMCTAQLTPPAVGRPPSFCSTTCRRAAELEIRRLQRRLERLENALSDSRLAVALSISDGQRNQFEREVLAYAAEIGLLQSRLQDLIADDREALA